MPTEATPEQNLEAGGITQQRTPAGRILGYLGRAVAPSQEARDTWALLNGYERFQHLVSLTLTALVSVLVIMTLLRLTYRVCVLVLFEMVGPSQTEIFQAIFGMVMTVLIALEFNHSILSVVERRHGLVQVRTVVLIAILALVRKFIIIDIGQESPLTMLGLAISVLALGAVYWLVREQDQREARQETLDPIRSAGR
jgi:uncharacterized membrane protein (DUF373 family)